MKRALYGILATVLVLILLALSALVYMGETLRHDAVPIVSAPVETAAVTESEASPAVGLSTPSPIYETREKQPRRINMLLVGIDTPRITEHSKGQADTILLVSLDKQAKSATLVSFHRDSYMAIAGDEGLNLNRLSTAYDQGGFGQLINTLNHEETYDLDIRYYVGLGLYNFEKLIDAIGGIDLALTAEECYYINWRCAGLMRTEDKEKRQELLRTAGLPILPERDGTYTLTGLQTLWYARNRTVAGQTATDDGERLSRQQRVLWRVYETVRDSLSLANLVSLAQFTLQNAETNLPLDMMMELGAFLFSNQLSVTMLRLPEAGQYSYEEILIPPATAPVTVLRFDQDAAHDALWQALTGEPDATDAVQP